ncbi:MAG TPA: DsbA family protein [Acidimicrobiales bacterium]|nr:DsbA family protein [Acidimicrobiales bacterium]
MSTTGFAVTYDYRCPFARNAHEHVVEGLRGGADWEVEFVPFSLTQVHLPEGVVVWEMPERAVDLLAIEAGLVVRERYPDRFLGVHLGLFAARHDHGGDLREESVVREVLEAHGLDGGAVLAEVADGWPRQAFRKAHESVAADHQVFGVPTFIAGEVSVFVRIMTRPEHDADVARSTIDHVLTMMRTHPEINEFKHTTVAR